MSLSDDCRRIVDQYYGRKSIDPELDNAVPEDCEPAPLEDQFVLNLTVWDRGFLDGMKVGVE